MVSPNLRASSTKNRLLNVSQELFLKDGFAGTSLDMICRKAGITKGGFFHYFKSKEDLGKAVLSRYGETFKSQMQEGACRKSHADPLKRIMAGLDHMVQSPACGPDFKGCLMASFIQEMSGSHPEIRKICSQSLQNLAQLFKDDLQEAKQRYAPRAKIDVASLAEHCVAVLEGAQVMARAAGDPSVITHSVQHLKSYLKSIFKQPTT